jgi:sugar lactone lactonase YvrE
VSTATAAQDEESLYSLPACGDGSGLVPGPTGGVLVALCGKKRGNVGKTVANLLPDDNIVRHRVPLSEPGPMAVGPNGEIWAVRRLAKDPYPTRVFRIGPGGTRKSFSLSQVEKAARPDSQFLVRDMVVDGEGNAWVATADLTSFAYVFDSYGGDIVRIAADGSETAFPLPGGAEPENLTVGSEGDVWFTAEQGRHSAEHSGSPGEGLVGRVTPDGTFATFPTPEAGGGGGPKAIATSPSGELWFIEPPLDRVGTIAPDGTFGPEHQIRFGVVGDGGFDGIQGGLAFDREGDAWLPALHGGVGTLSPAGVVTRHPGPPQVRSLAVGKEGDVWFLRRHEIRRLIRGST